MHENSTKPNLRRQPLRGVLSEIAREEGVTRQAVQKRVSRGDPDTLARIVAKVRARQGSRCAGDGVMQQSGSAVSAIWTSGTAIGVPPCNGRLPLRRQRP
ncbi:MAG TPA: hypothetical protein VHI13_15220 [Candidatus Kapabacteria bacterium]|nr:hypothetical protein [Candidatus Kapabacteria bacterium]